MTGTPIWTAKKDAGLSGYFDVTDPPMTISVDHLKEHEVAHVRSSNQGDTGPEPFRSGGNVQADYNNTKILIFAKGRFCLELEKAPKDPRGIDATRI